MKFKPGDRVKHKEPGIGKGIISEVMNDGTYYLTADNGSGKWWAKSENLKRLVKKKKKKRKPREVWIMVDGEVIDSRNYLSITSCPFSGIAKPVLFREVIK